MGKSGKKPSVKKKRDYEKALNTYMSAKRAFQETGNDADRHRWQRSMQSLLHTYSAATGMLGISREISLYWEVVHDLSAGFQSIVDGKDSDLFQFLPSDKYDSTMRSAIATAVRYVIDASDETDKQRRKCWIMEMYGVSRSTLNEWIKTKHPADPLDPEIESAMFEHYIDYYRKNKLTGRRRKPL